MIRTFLAAAAAFALVSATPALACPDCKDCPMHKDKVAASTKAEKKAADKKAADKTARCGCTDGKDCTCGAKCGCAEEKKAEKKGEAKKT